MAKREKKLIKAIASLEKQKERHFKKLREESGRKDTTPAYWRKEIKTFEEEIEKKKRKLKRK